jgi:drug/metabolite transporter (DMT)-like permease
MMKYYIYLWSTAFFWGVSFIATSVIVEVLPPINTAMIRFLFAWLILAAIARGKKPLGSLKDRFLGGLWGITLYFAFENYALKYTTPTNVSLIISTIPLFNLLFLRVFSKVKTDKRHLTGSLIAFVGVAIVIIGDQFRLEVNPIGDLLTFGAVISWIMYTHHIVQIEKQKTLQKKEHGSSDTLAITRSITFWGFLLLVPSSIGEYISQPFNYFEILSDWKILLSMLYLGLICSSIAYYFWNESIRKLGSRKTTNAIYIMPLITAFSQAILLKDIPHMATIIGGVFVIVGLFYTEKKKKVSEKKQVG